MSRIEIAAYQQQLYKLRVKATSSNQHTNQEEWGGEACAFKTTRNECRSIGRCDWKPLSFLQRLDFRHYNFPRYRCKEDETFHKHLVYELANYGSSKIVTEESILFPEGLKEDDYRNHFNFDTQVQLQQLIIPEIDEVTVDAIFKDFLVEHQHKSSSEGQNLKAMSQLFLGNDDDNFSLLQHIQNVDNNNGMDVGSKLSILYLLYKSKTITSATRGIFEALRCPDYTFYQKIDVVNNMERIKIRQEWKSKDAIVVISMVAIAVFLYMQAPEECKQDVDAVVQWIQNKIHAPENASRVAVWVQQHNAQVERTGQTLFQKLVQPILSRVKRRLQDAPTKAPQS